MKKTPTPLTLAEYRALVTGIPLYCPNAIFSFASQNLTAPQAVTLLTTLLDAASASATAKGAWKDARLAEVQVVTQNGAAAKEIRGNIASMFSNALNTLTAFEIAPRKVPAPLSAEARLAATAKMRATRAARGITSKKQKATLTGNVTGVTITPVTTPRATPAAASSSATAPSVSTLATTPAAPANGSAAAK